MNRLLKKIAIISAAVFCAGVSDAASWAISGITEESAYFSTEKLILGDVSPDGVINSSDASLILAEYSMISVGKESILTKEQAKAAELFQTTLLGDLDEVQKAKAFAETVYKVKQSSIEMRMGRAAETGDLTAMQEAIAEQASLKTSLMKAGL